MMIVERDLPLDKLNDESRLSCPCAQIIVVLCPALLVGSILVELLSTSTRRLKPNGSPLRCAKT